MKWKWIVSRGSPDNPSQRAVLWCIMKQHMPQKTVNNLIFFIFNFFYIQKKTFITIADIRELW